MFYHELDCIIGMSDMTTDVKVHCLFKLYCRCTAEQKKIINNKISLLLNNYTRSSNKKETINLNYNESISIFFKKVKIASSMTIDLVSILMWGAMLSI